MTDAAAQDILRSGYDRWTRLEEAKAEVADDLKELFAELKANGLDPKATRVAFRRVRDMNDAAVQELDEIADLYVSAIVGPRARPARECAQITEPAGTPPASASDGSRPLAASVATPIQPDTDAALHRAGRQASFAGTEGMQAGTNSDTPKKFAVDASKAHAACRQPEFCGQNSMLALCGPCRGEGLAN